MKSATSYIIDLLNARVSCIQVIKEIEKSLGVGILADVLKHQNEELTFAFRDRGDRSQLMQITLIVKGGVPLKLLAYEFQIYNDERLKPSLINSWHLFSENYIQNPALDPYAATFH